ncbi:MAG TPA: tetratricopeptide repeat protein [Drouetiella sp.]
MTSQDKPLCDADAAVTLASKPIRFFFVDGARRYVNNSVGILFLITVLSLDSAPQLFPLTILVALLGAPVLIDAMIFTFASNTDLVKRLWRIKFEIEKIHSKIPYNPIALSAYSSAFVCADLSDAQGDKTKATQLRQSAYKLYINRGFRDEGDQLVCETLLLKDLLAERKPDQLSSKIQSILERAERLLHQRPSQMALCYAYIAEIKCESGACEEAIRLGEHALSALVAANINQSNKVLTKQIDALSQTYRALGNVYHYAGFYDKAEECFEKYFKLRLSDYCKNFRDLLLDFYNERVSNNIWRGNFIVAESFTHNSKQLDNLYAASKDKNLTAVARFNRCHLNFRLKRELTQPDEKFFVEYCDSTDDWMPRCKQMERQILLGEFYARKGDLEKSNRHFDRAIDCVRETGLEVPVWMGRIQSQRTRMEDDIRVQRQLDEAVEHWKSRTIE